ncbi:MAG: ABC transporter permease [Synergistaceae bacterium]|jgi:simple sugar transport system permease protein|nr:ABC transporter permease [Synergistaceae bacterium]
MIHWKLEPRPNGTARFNFAVTAASLCAASAIGGLLMGLMGVNPFHAYFEIFRGALGSKYGLSETLVKSIPITLTGLACLLAFRMSIWNIGAEGQLVMGAIAAAAFVRYCRVDGSVAAFACMFAASAAAGGLWGALPGFLKGRWNVNEIISTLMLNYIALCLMDLLLYGAWKDPTSMGFPMTPSFPKTARLWVFGNTRLHGGLIMALIFPVVAWAALRRTQWGFEIRVIGENARAARYSGMGILKNIVLVMFLSGAIAGLCGMSEVAGLHGRLSRGFSVGYGFTGVIVAWLTRLNALLLPMAAFLMSILLVGGDTLQVTMALPLSSVQVIQGLILFCVLGGEVFRGYRLRRVRAGGPSPEDGE